MLKYCSLKLIRSEYVRFNFYAAGSEIFAVTDCPPSLYGSFTYNKCNDPNSNATSMDVCATRQQLVYNYTLCGTEQMYSGGY